MKKDRRYAAYMLLCVWWMNVISGFSADSVAESDGKSGVLSFVAAKVLNFFGINNAEGLADTLIRKSAHMVEFAFLAALFALVLYAVWAKPRIFAPVIFASVYAAFDEIHQMFVPGRGPSFADVTIDSAGAIIGIMLFVWFLNNMNKRGFTT